MFYDIENKPLIVGGRYGLSSKDTTPAMMVSVFENLKMNEPFITPICLELQTIKDLYKKRSQNLRALSI